MYVTPPDTDIYSIPRVLAPMPQKVHISCYFLFLVHVKCIRLLIVDFLFEIQYVRCVKKNFGRYHVSEPPVEHLRDPLYKTEREIMKVCVRTLPTLLVCCAIPLCSFCCKPNELAECGLGIKYLTAIKVLKFCPGFLLGMQAVARLSC